MKKRRVQNNTSVYAAIGLLNCCLIVLFAIILTPQPQPVVNAMSMSIAPYEQPATPRTRVARQGVPVRVIVPSVSIDMSVKPGSYQPENKSWTTEGGVAFYADRTVPANDSNGVTLVYGHGTWDVFGNIPNIREGAEARVATDNGLTFRYLFESSREVLPNDISILTNSGPPKLVLQTCSGPFDKYRTLVSFRLVGVSGDE